MKFKLFEEFSYDANRIDEASAGTRDARSSGTKKPAASAKAEAPAKAEGGDKQKISRRLQKLEELNDQIKKSNEVLTKLKKQKSEIEEDVIKLIQETKQTTVRVGKFIALVETKYNTPRASYKTGFDYLFDNVTEALQRQAEAVLEGTKEAKRITGYDLTVTKTNEGALTNVIGKLLASFKTWIKSVLRLNDKTNAALEKAEKALRDE
jgi:hypothetical protein